MWRRGYRPYVRSAERRAKAARELTRLAKKGHRASPVVVGGRAIATTFWGKAWCDNLESYSDFSNRLPRGRTYVRNGSVVDLQIEPGGITALVSGSDIYRVGIGIDRLAKGAWNGIRRSCAGRIASMIELLQGRLSQGVMEVITRHNGGMFPAPKEISMKCSCPDWATMCKHVAAVLYGVGARLDHQPELLFTLRQVDHLELIAGAGDVGAILAPASSGRQTIADADLADVFGIELEAAPARAGRPAVPGGKRQRARAEARSHTGARKTSRTARRAGPARQPRGKR